MSRRSNANSLHGMIRSGFQFTISYTCSSFNSYLQFQEENFSRAKEQLDKDWEILTDELEDEENDYDEDYAEHLRNCLIEKSNELHDDFTTRIRESIIIQLYSYLEKETNNITYQIALALKNKEERLKVLKKTQGSFLEKQNAYFKKYTSIDLEHHKELYRFIDNFRHLRNVIVHLGGRFNTEKEYKEVVDFADGHFTLKPYIKGSAKCDVIFDDVKFLIKCISEVEKFLHQMIDFQFRF